MQQPERNRNRTWLTAAVMIVAIVALVQGVRWTMSDERAGRVVSVEAENEAESIDWSTYAAAGEPLDAAAQSNLKSRIATAAAEPDSPVLQTQADRQRLAEQAGEVLTIYRQGSADEFIAWLRAQGLEPKMDYTAEDPDGEEWQRRVHVLANAGIDPERVRVIVRVRDGTLVYHKISSSWASYPQSPPTTHPANVVEVLIPAVLRRTDETPFTGGVGLKFGRDSTEEEWVFLGANIYDIPPKTGLAPLPM